MDLNFYFKISGAELSNKNYCYANKSNRISFNRVLFFKVVLIKQI